MIKDPIQEKINTTSHSTGIANSIPSKGKLVGVIFKASYKI